MIETTAFIGVLLIGMLGFAIGLGMLLYGNHEDFGEPARAIISVFNYGLYSEFGDFWTVFSTDGQLNIAALLLFRSGRNARRRRAAAKLLAVSQGSEADGNVDRDGMCHVA